MRKIPLALLAAVCLAAFLFGGYQVYLQLSEDKQGKDSYASLGDYAILPDPPPTTTQLPDESGDSTEPVSDILWPEVDFDALAVINPDIVGWLYCEDTVINYPIVQGNDDSFYLKHLFDGTYNDNGCLFLDSRGSDDFSDRHSIIYGHHMRNRTMFSSLEGYKEQAYYDEHPQLLLVTPDANYVVEIIAGYVANVQDDAWMTGFANDLEFEEWISAAIDKSKFESDVRPLPTDRILTLSTCSYEFNNARFVVLSMLQEH